MDEWVCRRLRSCLIEKRRFRIIQNLMLPLLKFVAEIGGGSTTTGENGESLAKVSGLSGQELNEMPAGGVRSALMINRETSAYMREVGKLDLYLGHGARDLRIHEGGRLAGSNARRVLSDFLARHGVAQEAAQGNGCQSIMEALRFRKGLHLCKPLIFW